MIFIGIDPGSQGAICLLESDDTIRFYDIPPKVTPRKLIDWLDKYTLSHRRHVWLEDVHSLPGMNAKSNFNFGRNYGLVIATFQAAFSRISFVPPKTWQKAGGVVIPKNTPASARKHVTAARALQLYPKAELYGPKGGLKDGRADALMIAHYAKLQGEGCGSL